jgi:hypothetical protein
MAQQIVSLVLPAGEAVCASHLLSIRIFVDVLTSKRTGSLVMFSCKMSTLFLMSTTLVLVLRTLPNVWPQNQRTVHLLLALIFGQLFRVFWTILAIPITLGEQ